MAHWSHNGVAENRGNARFPELWGTGLWLPGHVVEGHKVINWFNRSDFGARGALTNMDPATAWVMSERGWALDFDGSNDYVNVPDHPDFNFGTDQDFTISAWVRTTVAASESIVSKIPMSVGWVLSKQSDGTVRFLIDDGLAGGSNNWLIASSDTITDGDWHHVVGTVDRDSRISIYVDGKVNSDTSPSQNNDLNNSGAVEIGERTGLSNWEFSGQIRGVQIYRRALDPNTIHRLAHDPLYHALTPRRSVTVFAPTSPPLPPPGIIPVAMHSYRRRRVAI